MEIESSTIRNYYKAAKLFCDMKDITLNWKRIAKGLPKQKQAADDRAPTLDEIKKLIEYPDKRIKPIIYTMLSSGIRKEAWEYLKWKHIVPILNDENKIIAAAKIIVYAGDNEEYYSFITPEAYDALKEWMDFRQYHGEKITGNSWVMRNLFIVSERSWKMKRDPNHSNNLGDINKPLKLSSDGVKSLIERAIHAQRLWTPLENGTRRREWKGMHGFRKFFKTESEKVMKSLHVEMLLGHNTGMAKNYYRPSEKEILELIDIIGYREDSLYREGCLDDICKILERYLDIQIKNWTQSFEHHQLKEKDWLQQKNLEFYDLHHSMKVYSNGAVHSLQFFKDELIR